MLPLFADVCSRLPALLGHHKTSELATKQRPLSCEYPAGFTGLQTSYSIEVTGGLRLSPSCRNAITNTYPLPLSLFLCVSSYFQPPATKFMKDKGMGYGLLVSLVFHNLFVEIVYIYLHKVHKLLL